MVRIGIDARLIGPFGIGSYIRGLLGALAGMEGDEQYVVFVPTSKRSLIPPRFETIIADVPPNTLFELPRLGSLVRRARIDLLHSPHFVIPATAIPAVTTLFDVIPFHYPLPNPIAAPYIAFMMQRAADKAKRVITISHAAKRDIIESIDCEPEKILAIHIGVDDLYFRDAGPRDLGPRYFLFVGNGAKHKNIATLLQAFAIVHQRHPDLRLVLAGGKHERHRGVPGVIVPGFVPEEDLVTLFRDAIAVVMPSFMEGFGLPPLEGMAVGTPAITSTADALMEVTGDAALHVDPRSPAELAAAMERMAGDPALRARLADAGRERARLFRWSRCAELTREVYREVLGGVR
jgi:glycosyltransferase involved in cell wall biosynthesis